MTRKKKTSIKKEKDLIRDKLIESEEKCRGLDNKLWIVAEFGFYIILIAFTIFAVGYDAANLMSKSTIDGEARHIEDNSDTIYYNLTRTCSDLDNCSIYSDINNVAGVNVGYTSQAGVGTLHFNNTNVTISPITELAILSNGYVATFTIKSSGNSITYYRTDGEIVKTFSTKLTSSGKLDSNTGVYAVCNSKKLEVVKYSIINSGEFSEELI